MRYCTSCGIYTDGSACAACGRRLSKQADRPAPDASIYYAQPERVREQRAARLASGDAYNLKWHRRFIRRLTVEMTVMLIVGTAMVCRGVWLLDDPTTMMACMLFLLYGMIDQFAGLHAARVRTEIKRGDKAALDRWAAHRRYVLCAWVCVMGSCVYILISDLFQSLAYVQDAAVTGGFLSGMVICVVVPFGEAYKDKAVRRYYGTRPWLMKR